MWGSIYLLTTVISWIADTIISEDIIKYLYEKGYDFIETEENSKFKKFCNKLTIVLKGIIPIYNIVNTTIIICIGKRFYERMETKLLKEEKIFINPKSEEKEIEHELINNQNEDLSQTMVYNIEDKNIENNDEKKLIKKMKY